MVNLLISVLLSGLAVTFAIEFLYLGLFILFDKDITYNVLTIPLSFGALWCFADLSKWFVVSVPATSFVVLMTNKFLNKPAVFNASRKQLPRL